MNSGGAHCLKYGVTTNNVLGVTHGADRRHDRRARRQASRRRRATICSASIAARKASSASSPRRRCASCARPEGARPVLFGFDDASRRPAPASPAIIGAGIIPVAMEFMDKPAIEICEAFAHAGYPAGCRGAADHRGRGLRRRDGRPARAASSRSPGEHGVEDGPREPIGDGERPRSGRAANPPSAPPAASPTISAWTAPSRPASCPVLRRIGEIVDGYGLRVANVFHAGDGNLHPLILYNANDPERAAEGRGGRQRHPQALRRGRRLPDRRARRRHREARPDARPVQPQADLDQQMRGPRGVRSGLAAQSGQGLSARRAPAAPGRRVSEPRGDALAPRPRRRRRRSSRRRRRPARRSPSAAAAPAPALGRPVRADAILSAARPLPASRFYEPAEMVIGARAGTPLAEVEAALADERPDARLRADGPPRRSSAPTGEPTIGGVAAANVSGPRRIHGRRRARQPDRRPLRQRPRRGRSSPAAG